MFRSFLFFLIFLFSILFSSHTAYAFMMNDRFCIVTIKNGEPTKADYNSTDKMISYQAPIPDFPQPIFTPVHRQGVWTINASREWVKYEAPSPKNIFDDIVKEPWSGRYVIAPMHPKVSSVIIYEKNTDHFKYFDRKKFKKIGRVQGPYVLSSRKETLIISKGIPFVVGEKEFYEWPVHKKLKEIGIEKIIGVHDAPAIGGVVIENSSGELIFFSKNNLQKLGQPYSNDRGRVYNLTDLSTAVMEGSNTIYFFRRNNAGEITSSIRNTTSIPKRRMKYRYLKQYKQLIRYNPYRKGQNFKWEKLYKDGFKSISKKTFLGETESYFDKFIGFFSYSLKSSDRPFALVYEVPSLGLSIFFDKKKLSIYNGTRFINVLENYRDVLGVTPRFISLPTINRVLISSDNGAFELQPDGNIRKLEFDLKLGKRDRPSFIDWPSSGVTLIKTQNSLYSLDKDLNISRIKVGTDIKGFSSSEFPSIPMLGDIVLTTNKGLVSVVDTNKFGTDICDVLH